MTEDGHTDGGCTQRDDPYDYLILTTAVTRPDLHRRIFPGYRAFIGSARIKWLINVDDVGTGYTVDETIEALKRLLAGPNVDIEFSSSNGRGCFFEASRRLALRASQLLAQCRTGVVWLEDDWVVRRRGVVFDTLSSLRVRLANVRSNGRLLRCAGTLAARQSALEKASLIAPDALWFVSLVPRARVSLNPGIWSRALFEQSLWQPLFRRTSAELDDPESLCADPLNDAAARGKLMVFVDPLFQDAGRMWSARVGLGKWEKAADILQQQGSVTYPAPGPGFSAQASELQRLSGWITLPGRKLGLAFPLVGRIELQADGLRVRLLGVPFLHLELRATAAWEADVYLQRVHGWARTYPFKKLPIRLIWHPDGRRIEVQGTDFSAFSRVSAAMPLQALWLGPAQAAAGLLMYVGTLVAAIGRLEPEPTRRQQRRTAPLRP